MCIFSGQSENKMTIPGSDWLRHFRLPVWNCWTEFKETGQETSLRNQRPLLQSYVVRAHRKTKIASWPIREQRWHIVLRCTICVTVYKAISFKVFGILTFVWVLWPVLDWIKCYRFYLIFYIPVQRPCFLVQAYTKDTRRKCNCGD